MYAFPLSRRRKAGFLGVAILAAGVAWPCNQVASEFVRKSALEGLPSIQLLKPKPQVAIEFAAWWLSEAMDFSKPGDTQEVDSSGWLLGRRAFESSEELLWKTKRHFTGKSLPFKIAHGQILGTERDGRVVKVSLRGVLFYDAMAFSYQMVDVNISIGRVAEGYRVLNVELPGDPNASWLRSNLETSVPYDPDGIASPEDRERRMRSIAAYVIGRDFDAPGRFRNIPAAMAAYTEALTEDPTNYKALLDRGFTKSVLNDKRGALEDFEKAHALAPGPTGAAYARALFANGRLEASVEEWTKSIRFYANASKYADRARAYAALGRWTKALSDCDIACEMDPYDGNVFLRRARVKYQFGDMPGARMDLRRAVQLYPFLFEKEFPQRAAFGMLSDSDCSEFLARGESCL